MSHGIAWGWPGLFLLGAYHGINPAMGWLFAVALGIQQHSTQAVLRALGPIAIGHGMAIGAAVALAGLAQIVLPTGYLKIPVAAALFALGLYKVVRNRHLQWGGMQVGFRELTIWSFLMASAHGAGLMVVPVMLGLTSMAAAEPHSAHMNGLQDPLTAVCATLVHTLGYLTLTGAIALVVYKKFGLTFLRKAWVNLDLIWAAALIVTGCFTLVI